MLVAQPRTAVIAVALAAALVAPPTAAASDLTVRARTALTLESVGQGRRLSIVGTLRDNVYQGMGRRTVRVSLEPLNPERSNGVWSRGMVRNILTDRNGRFTLTDLVDDGTWRVEASFGGDELHGRSSAAIQVEIRRQPVRIALTVPAAAPVWAAIPVEVTLLGPVGEVDGLPVSLLVDGRVTPRGLLTDRLGEATGRLERLQRPGDIRVTAVFVGNHLFEPARESAVVRLYAQAEMVLAAGVQALRDARLLVVQGTLSCDQGSIADGRVQVAIDGLDGEQVVLTDEDGRFDLVESIGHLQSNRSYMVRAHFDPLGTQEPDLRVSESTAFVIERTALESAGQWASFAAVVLCVGLFSVLLAGRIVLELRRRRRARPVLHRPGRAAPPGLVELSPQGPGSKAQERRVSGVVRDADTARPVSRGEVIVEHPDWDAPKVYPIATDGAFATGPLAPGRSRVRVAVEGYVGTVLDVTIPHRGRYNEIEVYVCSVRSWIRYLYQALTVELGLDDAGRAIWGRATPRQIEALMMEAHQTFRGEEDAEPGRATFRKELAGVLDDPTMVPADRLLRALTLLVEEVYYSGRVYAEEMIAWCRSLIEGVRSVVQGTDPGRGEGR